MATTATIANARAGLIQPVEVGGGFSVPILSKVAMAPSSHLPSSVRPKLAFSGRSARGEERGRDRFGESGREWENRQL
ncbi:hypothetical protein JCM18882A_06820 [Brevibacterium metallidurans]|uniref:Uncharacterized protein n=1 Tax=Brevibacterium metallidurans TaxID=1482676 RepID=A0ABN0SL86_9MICO